RISHRWWRLDGFDEVVVDADVSGAQGNGDDLVRSVGSVGATVDGAGRRRAGSVAGNGTVGERIDSGRDVAEHVINVGIRHNFQMLLLSIHKVGWNDPTGLTM